MDGYGIKLAILGPIALFSKNKYKTRSGKHLEEFSDAHIVFLMYKLVTSSRGSGDLSVRFDRHHIREQRELIENKNKKGKYRLRIMVEDVFRFAERQEKATYGLSYELTLTRIKDDAASKKVEAIDDARI